MKNIEFIARAIIIHDGKMMLCKAQGAEWNYFPGGHVEFGETATVALDREFKEELGVGVKNVRPVTILENIFQAKMFEDTEITTHHEVIMIYRAELEQYAEKSLEGHIDFEWVDLETYKARKILPETMKEVALEIFESEMQR